MSKRTTSILGLTFLALGILVLVGEFWRHAEFRPLAGSLGFGSAIFGALMLDFAPVKERLQVLVDAVLKVLPWKKAE